MLTAHSIAQLRARIVAGAANNQLAQGQDGQGLPTAGILYAPDYVINAGGIISVAREYRGGATEEQVIAEIHAIPVRLTEIFERARRRADARAARLEAWENVGYSPSRPVALFTPFTNPSYMRRI